MFISIKLEYLFPCSPNQQLFRTLSSLVFLLLVGITPSLLSQFQVSLLFCAIYVLSLKQRILPNKCNFQLFHILLPIYMISFLYVVIRGAVVLKIVVLMYRKQINFNSSPQTARPAKKGAKKTVLFFRHLNYPLTYEHNKHTYSIHVWYIYLL